jgi:hypothetical protein
MRNKPRLGSLESRAIARRALDSRDSPPAIFVSAVEPPPRDELGRPLAEPLPCESRRAVITCFGHPDRELIRKEGESLADFEQRVEDALPVGLKIPPAVFFWPEPSPSDAIAANKAN